MYILVKNLNGRLIFIMDNEVDFEVLLNELKGLLVQSFFKKKDYYPKAFFDLKGSNFWKMMRYYNFLVFL